MGFTSEKKRRTPEHAAKKNWNKKQRIGLLSKDADTFKNYLSYFLIGSQANRPVLKIADFLLVRKRTALFLK